MDPKTTGWLAAAGAAAAAAFAGGALAISGAASPPGNAAIGKALFVRSGLFCASCHALKAVGSTGRDGPNLDQAHPSYATVVKLVTTGHNPSRRWPTGMPRYGGAHGEIPNADIRDIAAFVSTATHK